MATWKVIAGAFVLSVVFQSQVPLADYTSWKVGGTAEHFCEPQNLEEMKEALLFAETSRWPVTLLGLGSNVLISDQGVSGLVIRMASLNTLLNSWSEDGNFFVDCLAGAAKSDILKVFLKKRLAPAAFLAGLPGDVGGGIVMNAGVGYDAHPKEFGEIVDEIEVYVVEGGVVRSNVYSVTDLEWVYRSSRGWQPGVIVRARLRWPDRPSDSVLKDVRLGNTRRKQTQPLHLPSCGSVFKNPPGAHSGALIESAGLKGFQIGGAQVSEKHANFIVNIGGASAQDIHQVMTHVQDTVRNTFGVSLTNEVAYLGNWENR